MDVSTAADHPAVYFLDHEDSREKPAFPPGWELAIDPDLDKCPRAPPIWRAG